MSYIINFMCHILLRKCVSFDEFKKISSYMLLDLVFEIYRMLPNCSSLSHASSPTGINLYICNLKHRIGILQILNMKGVINFDCYVRKHCNTKSMSKVTSNVDLTNYRLKNFILSKCMDQKLNKTWNATADGNPSRVLLRLPILQNEWHFN